MNEIECWNDISVDHYSVRVNRYNSDLEPFDNKLSKEQKEHISETALDNYEGFDYIVKNITQSDLQSEAQAIFTELENCA